MFRQQKFLPCFLAVATVLTLSFKAEAYQKEIIFRVGARNVADPIFRSPSPRAAAEKIDQISGLRITRLEAAVKNDKMIQRLNSPLKFIEELGKRLENPVLYQSWLEEVNELFNEKRVPLNLKPKRGTDLYSKYFNGSKIDIAKKIAREAMLFAVLSNWNSLKTTIFNDLTVENRDTARTITLSKFKESFVYDPKTPRYTGHDQNYYFEFESNSVMIDRKTLSVVRVVLSVDPRLDNNSLEAGAEDIRADNDENSESTPAAE